MTSTSNLCARTLPGISLAALAVAILGAVGALALSPSPAAASDLWESIAGAPDSDSDGDSDEPSALSPAERVERLYQLHLTRGDRYAIQAMEIKIALLQGRQSRKRVAYFDLIDKAVSHYEQAARARPDAAAPHYRAAAVLHRHLIGDSIDSAVLKDRTAAERILAHWAAFERVAPLDPRLSNVLDRRAILYTRLATPDDIERAIIDYEKLLSRHALSALSAGEVARWLGNLAEVYMMAGHLDEAIATYRRASSYSNEPLYSYGLAVALDRDGQGEMARQVMGGAIYGDNLRSLTAEHIFFVPEGEISYYLALGFEVMGKLKQAEYH
ncbi:MAG: hypothetical protein AAGC55_23545, partial [Myxococcota bacterium]